MKEVQLVDAKNQGGSMFEKFNDMLIRKETLVVRKYTNSGLIELGKSSSQE